MFAPNIILHEKEVAEAVWHDFIPQALVDGRLKCKPDPMVIKGGLEAIQHALDVQKHGVSAAKVVVEIQSL